VAACIGHTIPNYPIQREDLITKHSFIKHSATNKPKISRQVKGKTTKIFDNPFYYEKNPVFRT